MKFFQKNILFLIIIYQNALAQSVKEREIIALTLKSLGGKQHWAVINSIYKKQRVSNESTTKFVSSTVYLQQPYYSLYKNYSINNDVYSILELMIV